MNAASHVMAPRRRARTYGWLGAGLSVTLAALVAAGALAQVATKTAGEYCYNGATAQCFDTLDKAEQAMRMASANIDIGALLEQKAPDLNEMATKQTASYLYAVKDQPASPLYAAAYMASGEPSPPTTGGHGCTPATGTPWTNWCADEGDLVSKMMDYYAAANPSCTYAAPTLIDDTRTAPYKRVTGGTGGGTVDYGDHLYQTNFTCQSGSSGIRKFRIYKQAPFSCPYRYTGLSDPTPNDGNGDLTLPVLCKYDILSYTIVGPVKQVASCPASKFPCYPATGDKARQEPDFAFAGRTFTRYYHAYHEFRNDPGSGIGWSHTFDDHVFGASTDATVSVIDESGTYESYARLSTGRYRGENSVDKVLSFDATSLHWQLKSPDGEYREFDANGLLLKIVQPSDPRLDVTLAYANGLLSTATDGQGRVLRFEYDAGKMLARIVLPDGKAVVYGYDAERNLTGVVYPDGRVREYLYAEAGLIGDPSQRHHLTGIIAEGGQRHASFKYDAQGRVIESRAFGTPENVTTVAYPSDTQSTVIGDTNDTRTYTIQPGLYRRITAMTTSGASGQDEQTFDAQGRLTRSKDRLGTLTDYEYDPTNAYRSAVVEAVGKPEQRRTEFVRDPALNRLTELRVRDAAGTLKAKTNWTYNTRGQLASTTVTDPTTNATRTATLAYCEQADVTAGTCPTVGLLKSVDGPLVGSNDTTTYSYRQADAATCATAPTTCPYRKGDLWKVTNALNQTIEILASDGAGRVLSMQDANGIVTDVAYDARGRVVAQKVRGTDASTEYDDQITRIEYDPMGSVQRMVLPDGRESRFEYDALQRLTAVIDHDGNRQELTLDAAGNVIGEQSRSYAGAVLLTLNRVYDTLGRLQQVTDGESHSTTFGYDAVGNATSERDPLLRDSSSTYDALGRLRTTIRNVGGIGAQTQVQYDALDRVVQVTDPSGLNTAYSYNGFGDVLGLTSPDTGTTTSTYDAAGRLATRTDARNITATYGYDLIDRVTSVTYPDTSRNLGFAYDAAPAECPAGERFHVGRVARMTDASGDTAFCYDRFGNLTRKVQATQGRSFTVRYDHAPRVRTGTDAPMRPRAPSALVYGITYPDGAQVRIGRNGRGQATALTVTLANGQVKTLVQETVHYPYGPAWWWTYGNGRKLTRSRTQSGRPGFVEDARAGGLNEGYWFDAAGNLESLRNASQADPPKRKYAYDGLDRLIEMRDGASDALLQGYAYNATGDRTSDTSGTTRSYVYAAGSHKLSSVDGVNRAYDAAGNTIRIGGAAATSIPPTASGPAQARTQARSWRAQVQARAQAARAAKRDARTQAVRASVAQASDAKAFAPASVREFAYDDAGRLKQVKRDGVVAMNYLYNAKGERVYRSGSGETVHTVYDEAGHWLGDYDAAGTALQQALWLDDLPVGLLVGAGASQKLYYLEPDALGSPRVAIDPDRDVAVWRWDLQDEAFGSTAPIEDPDADGIKLTLDMRFPGQRYDAASELVYNYFRDYDPSTGRYVQSDPIGLRGGSSTYGYAGGNSLTSTDFFGLIARVCRDGDKIVIIEPVNFGFDPDTTPEARRRAFEEAEKVWTRKIGRYDVHIHIMDGRRDPDAVLVQLHHYQIGDQSDRANWYIPNPSDGRNWTNYDWSVFGHEIGHDLLGFPDNAGYDRNTVMSPRSGSGPRFLVSEMDIEFLLDNLRTIKENKMEACKCPK